MTAFTESVVEQAALAWFESPGYTVKAGPDIAPDGSTPERGSYTEVILHDRLRWALAQLDPTLPAEARNRAFHRMVAHGVTVEYRKPKGAIAGAQVRVLDLAREMREAVRARLPVIVKRILREHGYPPNKQEKATETVLLQAEVLSNDWATEAT